MNFAREGIAFIVGAVVVVIAAYLVALTRRSWPMWLIAFALTIVAIWVAYFFRDPERPGQRDAAIVIAPADGKIVQITPVAESTFMHAPAIRISIFMNIFNVHVNRYPISGTVEYVTHSPGRFFNAMEERASLQNEQTSVGITSGAERILVRQIAGLIARRIVTYSATGEHVRQGERMGLIRFGSRVDVFVPESARVAVKVGDMTFAGVTVLAETRPR
jgi:phosphatidylserine decarboxylase